MAFDPVQANAPEHARTVALIGSGDRLELLRRNLRTSELKNGRIPAPRNLDQNRIVRSRTGVILEQLLPKPTGLNTNLCFVIGFFPRTLPAGPAPLPALKDLF